MLCKVKFKFSTIQGSVFRSSVLEDGQPMGGVCRACMHSFFIDCQSLRELRITSVLTIAAIQQRNVGRIKCNGPVNFFSERRYFKQHMRFPAQPPPPPHQASSPLLGNPPAPPPPRAPLFWRRGHLRLWGSDRGVLSIEG